MVLDFRGSPMVLSKLPSIAGLKEGKKLLLVIFKLQELILLFLLSFSFFIAPTSLLHLH